FPVTPDAYQASNAGNVDAFITKINPTGTTLQYSTYLGGTNYDFGYAIAVDNNGNAYITGYTESNDFPVTPDAYQASYAGNVDAFITKINPTGTTLQYSTYLGGTSTDYGRAIAIDNNGNAYITGNTESNNFPVTPDAYQASEAGNGDGFVAKFGSTIKTVTQSFSKTGFAGKNVELTAQVEDDNGNPINEGQVQFSVNGNIVGTANVVNGQATYTYQIPGTWKAGTYPILAEYLGTGNYQASSATATLTVNPTSSLYLTITSDKNNPIAGDTVTYTIKVGNRGPDTASDVVMTYQIPPGLEFASASVDKGTWTYQQATRTLTWNINDVPVGDPYLWLDLKYLKPGTYQINPRLSTTTYDPTIDENTESITVNAAEKIGPRSEPVNGKTVPMQKTGTPLTILVLAVLMVLGGIVSTKK
ncbi:MAG: SBBP repeat-containing protein, partial [Methanobacteriaceae archaeon]|nr:SBBP repeat-containing protein [Methanobacteriaceae archaeon]